MSADDHRRERPGEVTIESEEALLSVLAKSTGVVSLSIMEPSGERPFVLCDPSKPEEADHEEQPDPTDTKGFYPGVSLGDLVAFLQRNANTLESLSMPSMVLSEGGRDFSATCLPHLLKCHNLRALECPDLTLDTRATRELVEACRLLHTVEASRIDLAVLLGSSSARLRKVETAEVLSPTGLSSVAAVHPTLEHFHAHIIDERPPSEMRALLQDIARIMPNLSTLHLWSSDDDDEGEVEVEERKAVAEGSSSKLVPFRHLRSLQFAGRLERLPIHTPSEVCFTAYAPVDLSLLPERFPQLRVLRCPTVEGAAVMMPTVVSFGLDGTLPLTRGVLRAVASSFPALQRLCLEECTPVSQRVLLRLFEDLPRLQDLEVNYRLLDCDDSDDDSLLPEMMIHTGIVDLHVGADVAGLRSLLDRLTLPNLSCFNVSKVARCPADASSTCDLTGFLTRCPRAAMLLYRSKRKFLVWEESSDVAKRIQVFW